MKVVLLGLEFSINNLGCEALSYSFVSELNKIAEKQNKELELVSVVFADKKIPYIPGTKQAIQCIGIHYKSLSFWKRLKQEFKTSDLIVDFTMGDSFSDIYGAKRFILDALVKTAAVRSGTPYILGPQTYGPYKRSLVKKWAAWIIKNANHVYSRDEKSKEVAEKLAKRNVILTTDVAFALPVEPKEIKDDRIKVGFNPSGLLWGGGYTHDNQFGLTIDYQEYCWRVCEALNRDDQYAVYLIPHVGTTVQQESGNENDLFVCQQIKKEYPDMTILDNVRTPMDVKGYIAAMDVFIGARMHATIGAFSSGRATIPVSYSRKFEGLYGSIDYNYVIHALKFSTEDAVSRTLEYIRAYKKLEQNVVSSMQLVNQKQDIFRNSLEEIAKTIKE